jgi:hypothetical protein
MISEKADSYEKVTYSVWTIPEDQIGEGGTTGAPTKASAKKAKKLKPVVIEQELPKQRGGMLLDALQSDANKGKGKGKVVEPKSVAGPAAEGNIKTIIITHLEKFKLIPTKNKLIEDLVILGYERNTVERQIDKLRTEGVILYSRSEPKGWSLGTY